MKTQEKEVSFKAHLKELLYEFYTQILMQNNFSFGLWLLSYIISYLQILDFLFHPFFDKASDESFVTGFLVSVFKYTSLREVMSNSTLSIVILAGSLLVMLYQILAYVYFMVSVNGLYSTTRKITKMPGLSFFFVIFNLYSIILFYPSTLVCFVFMSPITDVGEGHIESIGGNFVEAGSVSHIIMSIVIFFIWFVMLLMQILTTLLTTEISTQRLVSWSAVEPYSRLAFIFIKIYQAFMLAFFDAPPIVEIAVVSIIGAAIAFLRLGSPASTIKDVHYIESFGDMFYTVMCVFVLTSYIWGEINCILPLAIVFAACIALLYIGWLRKRLLKLLTLPYLMNVKKPVEAYNYICGIGALLESKDDQSRDLLSGIALNHNRICDNVTCWCQEVKNAMSSKGKDPEHRGELKEMPQLSIDTDKAVEYQNKSKIGRWILSLQSDIMMSQNNSLMNIIMSYIYYFYIGNTYQSLNYLDIALTHKPGFLEAFAIYIHRRRIEASILLSHELNLLEGAMPIDIHNLIDFSQTYNSFLEIVQDCANTYQQFWKELMKDLPDSAKLSDNGKEISEKWQTIQNLFNKLLVLMPKNMNYLYLFGLFLKYITNDSEESKKIHQKLVYIRNSKSHLKGPEYEKFMDEGRAMMFLVSGSRDSIGRIKEVNVETEKILGYNRKDLKGSKINKFMCSVLSENHDGFMTKFYETLLSNKVNHSSFQYMMESSGYYIPIQILIRIVPNISDGLEFCALCFRNETNPHVSAKINKTRNRIGTIICDESFRVLGITRSCSRTLKLPPSLIQKGFPDNFVFIAFPMMKDENVRNKLFESRGRVINYTVERIQELHNDEEDQKSPEALELKYSKKEELLMWVRLVKQDFNDSKAILHLIIFDQVPNIDAANYIAYEENGCQFFMNPSEGAGPKVAAILPQIFRMNSEFDKRVQRGNRNPFDYAESVFAESMLESLPSTASQSSSSIGTISKDLTTFKERISDSEDPASVKRLRVILVIFVIFIIGIVIAELTINLIVTNQFKEQFLFVGYLAERITTLFLSANRIRTYTSMIDVDSYRPQYSNETFKKSISYLQQYATEIVRFHEQIVHIEDDMNLNDGAQSITMLYKDKYMESHLNSINYSFAVMEFVVKMLQIVSYDSLYEAQNLATTNNEEYILYQRMREFLIYNSNHSLRLVSEQIMDKYLTVLEDKADNGKTYEIVLNSVSLGVIILLFFLVVPIIITVVSEKSTVMKGFAYVTKKEISDIMNWASAFNVRYSAKSLKLLAETRKDKVYALMEMQKEKQESVEDKQQEFEVEKTNKLRTLIRNLFKFEDEGSPKDGNKEEEGMGLENSLPENRSSIEEPFEASRLSELHERSSVSIHEEEGADKTKHEVGQSPNESILPLEAVQETTKEDEKILHKQKKACLSKIDTTLRRRALIKVGFIFIIFIVYSIVNIVYIVMFHSYAVKASNQYNDIHMQRPLMSEMILMCRQAFFENDTNYLITDSTNSIRRLPEYRNWLLAIEESILDFEKNGPEFIFPSYIKKLKKYNDENFCTELGILLVNDNNCSTYDSGFYKNGLRAAMYRFVTFWQSLAQRFLKADRTSASVLAEYKYASDVTSTIDGMLRYTNKAVEDLIKIFDSERKTFLSVVEGISWGKAMIMIFILLISFVVVFMSFLRQLKEEISLTKAMMKMIPLDLLEANTKILKKVLRGSTQVLQHLLIT